MNVVSGIKYSLTIATDKYALFIIELILFYINERALQWNKQNMAADLPGRTPVMAD